MSAFFVWLELSEQAVDESVARAMLSEISGYGGDDKDLLLNKKLAIGVQTRWTTAEERDIKQPLFNASETECFVFNGRIDNREHLIAELSVSAQWSDAQLMQEFLSRFGPARLAEVIGPFVFVLVDLARGRVLCARDAMGGRYLAYRLTDQRLIISSTERAFIAHPDVGHNLSERKVSAWLINHQEHEQLACLDGLSTLNPGSVFEWSSQATHKELVKAFYRPNPERRISLPTDEAYAQEFRRLLSQAVKRRTRCVGKVGVMLSGGMDSVPITISAAEYCPDLVAYSWVFDESPDMDERKYSSPICKQLGIRQELIHCDSLWPAFDEGTHSNPLFPIALHYSEFNQHTLDRARGDGVQVMLTGLHGDLLYQTANRQVLHGFKLTGFKAALSEFKYLRKQFQLNLWQALKRYVLAPVSFIEKYIDRRRQSTPVQSDILVAEQLAALKQGKHWLYEDSCKALRPLQYRVVLDGFAGEDTMLGRHMENKYGIERRYPFRDRELCEFMLAIPTDQLEKLGVQRPIVKLAYAAEFSEALMRRNDKTRFVESFYKGLKRDRKWQTILLSEPQVWKKFVKECNIHTNEADNDLKAVVKWQCAYYNFWHKTWFGS